MRLDRSFRSRYKFVANSFERIRSSAKNDFVFSKRSFEHSFVSKIQYTLLSKERHFSAKTFAVFEFLFSRYVFAKHFFSFANHFVLLAKRFVLFANHFVFFANYEFHAANLFEKFVISRAKISHQSRKSVELLAVVVTLLLSVVISFVIFLTRFAIVKIVM